MQHLATKLASKWHCETYAASDNAQPCQKIILYAYLKVLGDFTESVRRVTGMNKQGWHIQNWVILRDRLASGVRECNAMAATPKVIAPITPMFCT